MKRIAAFIAAIDLAFSLAACGTTEPQEGSRLPVNGMTDRMPRTLVSL